MHCLKGSIKFISILPFLSPRSRVLHTLSDLNFSVGKYFLYAQKFTFWPLRVKNLLFRGWNIWKHWCLNFKSKKAENIVKKRLETWVCRCKSRCRLPIYEQCPLKSSFLIQFRVTRDRCAKMHKKVIKTVNTWNSLSKRIHLGTLNLKFSLVYGYHCLRRSRRFCIPSRALRADMVCKIWFYCTIFLIFSKKRPN